MKNVFLLFLLTCLTVAFAQESHLDFDENLEKDCYSEAVKLKCSDSNELLREDCLDKKHDSFSLKCRSLHIERKKRKAN